MQLDHTDSGLFRARAHIAEAIRLRGAASKLKTVPAKTKLAQLADLYEQLSLCYLGQSSEGSSQ